jgi:hypothetical protein
MQRSDIMSTIVGFEVLQHNLGNNEPLLRLVGVLHAFGQHLLDNIFVVFFG